MNAVEIEEAVSVLAEQPFDRDGFPYAFLEAFGNKATTIKKLKSGASNKSDVGGVLQTNNIHIKVCDEGQVADGLKELLESPATTKAKAKFVLATDGKWLEAEDLNTGETIACDYPEFHNHFGFFLSLAGISTVKAIRESAFDIKATGRLNKLYVELLKTNPEWGTDERRHDMNHFMARLIFCFFAEDTDIFSEDDLFTSTIETMTDGASSNTHEVIGELFRAMDTKPEDRAAGGFRSWADKFPYVNGGLFSGSTDTPKFSKIARSYLLHIGKLDWKKINPDIFGSMIQAVADDEERGALGMHYTSVSNILKVLNPLFLDELREKLEEAGDNNRKLLNLRTRLSKIRVFDPACGSGNFLVIAYKEMRAFEAEINKRRGEPDRRTDIPLTNFRGIELRDFPAEIARLALIIAEYQCDVLYRGQKEALKAVLPLNKVNWITCGNALRLDWLSICPPTGTGVKHHGDDLFNSPIDQAEIDFENEGGETYICGNPPYKGDKVQTPSQKKDMEAVFSSTGVGWRSLDYVAAWFFKSVQFGEQIDNFASALVSTNSICQGQQVPILWPLIFQHNHEIFLAHTSFKWANLASHNAGVTVAIIGLTRPGRSSKVIVRQAQGGDQTYKHVRGINAYLLEGENVIVYRRSEPISPLPNMVLGNMPKDGGNLIFDKAEFEALRLTKAQAAKFIRPLIGSREFINGTAKYCLWISDDELSSAKSIASIDSRIEATRKMRSESKKVATRKYAQTPHKFVEIRSEPSALGSKSKPAIVLPRITSGNRRHLPVGICQPTSVISSQNFAFYDPPLWIMSLLVSGLHHAWVSTVCGRTRTDFAYSNSLGWNTFPVPTLTEKNKADLTQCAEDILLAREAHFPATIADLYDPEKMPENLREAHERNDEVLERIYIGRRFKNDTERLEKLFELYTKMTNKESAA